eukprot:SAG31_NODE_22899_length_515_cov_5.480769_1_plen_36_part_10
MNITNQYDSTVNLMNIMNQYDSTVIHNRSTICTGFT